MADLEKRKFSKTFSKIRIILSNRKKESSKIYFKKPSLKSILISVACSLLVVEFVFRIIKIFDISSSTLTNDASYLFTLCGGLAITFIVCTLMLNEKIFNYVKIISCLLIIIGMFGTYFNINDLLSTMSALLLGLGYGIVFGCIVNLFLYSFDMSERLIFCFILLFFFFSYSLYYNLFSVELIQELLLPVAFCLFTTVMFIICKDYFVINRKNEIIPKYSFALLIGIIFIVCMNQAFIEAVELKIHPLGITEVKSFYSKTYYIGFLLCCVICIPIFLYSKNSLMFILTLYFIAVFGGYQLTIFYEVFDHTIKAWRQCADVAFGFSTSLGYITLLMFTAKILDDKTTRFNLFYTIICFTCFAFSSMFLKKTLLPVDIRILSIVMMIFNIIIALVLIIVNLLGYMEIRNTKNTPIGEINRNLPKYKIINPAEVLTPKEKIVFDLLLEGLTLRQIAGELSMKYDSVNFHYKNIYRKLEVNSKIELILRYGGESK